MDKLEITHYKSELKAAEYRITLFGEKFSKLVILVFEGEGAGALSIGKDNGCPVYQFPINDYLVLLDLLRNSKPLFLNFGSNPPETIEIHTNEELVGEHECKYRKRI